jgi:hypothetical protein
MMKATSNRGLIISSAVARRKAAVGIVVLENTGRADVGGSAENVQLIIWPGPIRVLGKKLTLFSRSILWTHGIGV